MRSSSRALDRSELLQVSALPRTVPSGQQVAMRRLAFQRERSAVWARADALQSKTKRLVMTHKRHAVDRDDICRVQERFSVAKLFPIEAPWVLSVFDPECPKLIGAVSYFAERESDSVCAR